MFSLYSFLFVVLNQVIVLFILMTVGFFAYRFRMFGEDGVKQMTELLLLIVTPCLIVYSFLHEKFTISHVSGLIISAALAAGVHMFTIILSQVVYRKNIPDGYRKVLKFAAVYSNAGFMGLPLIYAVIGTEGTFYGSVFIAVFNLFLWTHGVIIYKQQGKSNTSIFNRKFLFKAVLNPNVIALVIGVLLFCFSIKLPIQIDTSLNYIQLINTPLSMLVIGSLMAKTNLKTLFNDIYILPGILMRNLTIPILFVIFMHIFKLSGSVYMACLLQVSCPVAGATALFAEKFGADTKFSAKLMTISTFFSILTIPLIILINSVLKI
jgi:predicted permease